MAAHCGEDGHHRCSPDKVTQTKRTTAGGNESKPIVATICYPKTSNSQQKNKEMSKEARSIKGQSVSASPAILDLTKTSEQLLKYVQELQKSVRSYSGSEILPHGGANKTVITVCGCR